MNHKAKLIKLFDMQTFTAFSDRSWTEEGLHLMQKGNAIKSKAIKCSSLLHQYLTCDELGPANSDLSDVFYGPYSLQLVNDTFNLKK